MTATFDVPYLSPLEWGSLLAWLRVRALPGVERADDDSYATAVVLPSGPAVLRMTNHAPCAVIGVEVHRTMSADGAVVEAAGSHRSEPPRQPEARRATGDLDPITRGTSQSELGPHDCVGSDAEARAAVIRMLDLDANPAVIDTRLAEAPVVGALVREAPGMRIPGEPTPLVALVRALAGQQVSVAGGLAQMYRLVQACRRDGVGDVPGGKTGGHQSGAGALTLAPFPDAETILAAGFDWYRGPSARRDTIRAAVEFAAGGGLDVSRETEAIADDLLALKGVGPWTVAYTLMRGYGDADVDLSGDRALVNAARSLSDVPLAEILDAARPFRSYAALHLWRSAGS